MSRTREGLTSPGVVDKHAHSQSQRQRQHRRATRGAGRHSAITLDSDSSSDVEVTAQFVDLENEGQLLHCARARKPSPPPHKQRLLPVSRTSSPLQSPVELGFDSEPSVVNLELGKSEVKTTVALIPPTVSDNLTSPATDAPIPPHTPSPQADVKGKKSAVAWEAYERYKSPRSSLPDYSATLYCEPAPVSTKSTQMKPPILSGPFKHLNDLGRNLHAAVTRQSSPPTPEDRRPHKVFNLNPDNLSNTSDHPHKRRRIEDSGPRGDGGSKKSGGSTSTNTILIEDSEDAVSPRPGLRNRRHSSSGFTVESDGRFSEGRLRSSKSLMGSVDELQRVSQTVNKPSKRGSRSSRGADQSFKKAKINHVESISDNEHEDIGRPSQPFLSRKGRTHSQTARKTSTERSAYFVHRGVSPIDNMDGTNGATLSSFPSLKRHQLLKAKDDTTDELAMDIIQAGRSRSRRSSTSRPGSSGLSNEGQINSTSFKSTKRGSITQQSPGANSSFKLKLMWTNRNEKATDEDMPLILKLNTISHTFDPYHGETNLSLSFPAFKISPDKILRITYCEDDDRLCIRRSTSSHVTSTKVLIRLAEEDSVGRFIQRLQNFNGQVRIELFEDSKRMDKLFNTHRQEVENVDTPKPLRAPSAERASSPTPTKANSPPPSKPRNHIVSRMQRNVLAMADEDKDHAQSSPVPSPTTAHPKFKPGSPITPTADKAYSTRSSTGRLPSRINRSPSPFTIFEKWTDKNKAWRKDWTESLVYPPVGRKKATVDADDIERLDEGEYLNDNLLSFYLRYLEDQLEQKHPEMAKRVYFQNTFFYEALTKSTKSRTINYEAVQRWTAKVDLFSYDYIVVPVNESNHWFLAIVCNVPALLTPTIDITDSPNEDVASKSKDIVNSPDPNVEFADAKALDGEAGKSKESPGVEISSSMQRMSIGDASLVTDKPGEPSDEVRKDSEHKERKEDTTGNRTRTIEDDSKDIQIDESLSSPAGKLARFKKGKRKSLTAPVRRLDPKEPRIITLDSLGISHSPVCVNLREYLKAEAQARHDIDISGAIPQSFGVSAKGLPHQNNHCDCGVFVLAYAEKFLEDPPSFVRDVVRKEMAIDTHWPHMDAAGMRAAVRELIFKLHKEQLVRSKEQAVAKKQARIAARVAAAAKKGSEGPDDSASPANVGNGDTSSRTSPEVDSETAAEAEKLEETKFSRAQVASVQHDEVQVSQVDGSVSPKGLSSTPPRERLEPKEPDKKTNGNGTKAEPVEIADSQLSTVLSATQDSVKNLPSTANISDKTAPATVEVPKSPGYLASSQ